MRWILRLYPREWRKRYEDEILTVLEEHKITPATVVDLIMGAFDANLNYNGFTEGVSYMVNRIRSRMIIIFCAFVLFGVGWSMIQRITDPMTNFQVIDKVHPEFGILFNAVFIVGCLSFLAILIGGLPIFYISVRRAIKNRQRDALIPFWTALSCLLLFIISTSVLANWHQIAFAKHHFYVFFLSYLTLIGIELIVGTVSVSLTLARTDFQIRELKFMFVPEIVILFGMIVSVVLSTIFIILITVYAPQLFNSQDVGSSMFITGIIFMALGTIFASMGFKRGTIQGLDQLTRV